MKHGEESKEIEQQRTESWREIRQKKAAKKNKADLDSALLKS